MADDPASTDITSHLPPINWALTSLNNPRLMSPEWYQYFLNEHRRSGGNAADRIKAAYEMALLDFTKPDSHDEFLRKLNEVRTLFLTQRPMDAELSRVLNRLRTLEALVFGARSQSAGSGNVSGPGSSTSGDITTWSGTGGTILADSGKSFSTDGTFASNSDALISTQKAVKTYVDAVAQGLSIRDSCLLATTAALPTLTYSNGASGVGATLTGVSVGALSIDGTALAVADRVLIKDQVATLQNGIYTCTATGSGIAVFVLTRATDYDQSADILSGTFTFIEEGTVNTGAGFVLTTVGTVTVGTTGLIFTQFSGAGEITVDASLTKSGNQLGRAALTGDVTASAGSNATTIANNAVTLAKFVAATTTKVAVGRNSASGGNFEEVTMSQILDWVGSAAQGDILYRGSSSWTRLAAGTAGYALTTNGAAANPSWSSVGVGGSGSGTSGDLAAAVATFTPTLYCKCDDASTTLVDSSGNGYDLTLAGTYTNNAVPLLPGDSTRYIRFTGTTAGGSRSDLIGLSAPLTGDWTIQMVVQFESFSNFTSTLTLGGTKSLETEINNVQATMFLGGTNAFPTVLWESGAGTDRASAGASFLRLFEPLILHIVKDSSAKTVTYYRNGRQCGTAVSYGTEPTGGTSNQNTRIGYDNDVTQQAWSCGHVAYFPSKLTAANVFTLAKASGLTGS